MIHFDDNLLSDLFILALQAGSAAIKENPKLRTQYFVKNPVPDGSGMIPFKLAAEMLEEAAADLISDRTTNH